MGAVSPLMENIVLRTATCCEKSGALSEAEVEVKLRRLQMLHKILVADIDGDFIISIDLIEKYGLACYP